MFLRRDGDDLCRLWLTDVHGHPFLLVLLRRALGIEPNQTVLETILGPAATGLKLEVSFQRFRRHPRLLAQTHRGCVRTLVFDQLRWNDTCGRCPPASLAMGSVDLVAAQKKTSELVGTTPLSLHRSHLRSPDTPCSGPTHRLDDGPCAGHAQGLPLLG